MGYALDNARTDNSNEQLGNEWTHSLIKQVATAMIATDRIATTAKIDLSYSHLIHGSFGSREFGGSPKQHLDRFIRFKGLAVVINTQRHRQFRHTDRPHHSVAIGRIHAMHAMRLKIRRKKRKVAY